MRYVFWLAGFSIVLAVLMQVPQWQYQTHPESRGILVSLNSDESIYLARVQESLSGRPEHTAEAFIGHDVDGSQFALIERVYGHMFRWTGWNAAEVFRVMDSVIPVLLFLSLFLFFRLCGFERHIAFFGAAIFCLLQLYSLSRPVHMRTSFLVTLWSMIGIVGAWKRRWWGVGIGGMLLGLTISIYVWSFMFAWAFWLSLLFLSVLDYRLASPKHSSLWKIVHFFRRKKKQLLPPWHYLLLAGGLGLIAAIPAFVQYARLLSHPLYEYAQYRSGIHQAWLPESFVYSALFAVMLIGVGVAYIRHRDAMKRFIPVIALVLAAVMYMNQQMVHGHTFNFVSHGIFSLMTAATAVALLTFSLRPKWLLCSAAAAAVYMGAIAYDGRFVLKQWNMQEEQLADQHLASAFTELGHMPRVRILSDSHTSALIAGFTKHDIVYSVYLKNVLLPHEEIALRYCLTQMPLSPDERNIAGTRHLVYPDAVSAFKGDTRQEEVALVTNACTELDLDPGAALEMFEVSHILWNKERQPQWNMRRLDTRLELLQETDTWALYRIVR